DGSITLFFIVGAPKSEIGLARLRAEQGSYHDVIVTDLKDTYEALVFKVNAMMNFFLKYCSKPRFLMKIDDDVTVHLDRMFTHWTMANRDEDNIYCRVCPACKPFRNASDKW
ncbi:hypothetical protein GCK32_021479, partial [Trichostrongylus colubriformis]